MVAELVYNLRKNAAIIAAFLETNKSMSNPLCRPRHFAPKQRASTQPSPRHDP
jgi:hypothetical protein